MLRQCSLANESLDSVYIFNGETIKWNFFLEGTNYLSLPALIFKSFDGVCVRISQAKLAFVILIVPLVLSRLPPPECWYSGSSRNVCSLMNIFATN